MLPDWLQQLADSCTEQERHSLRINMHKTQVERTRRWRESQKAKGTTAVTVQCPVERVDELKAMVRAWREGKE